MQDKNNDPHAQFAPEKQRVATWIKRRLKRANAVLQRYQEDFERCSRWNDVRHEATLLQAHYFLLKRGISSISVPDWEQENQEKVLELNPLLEPSEQVALRFKQAKKMQRALQPLTVMIQKTEAAVAHWLLCTQELEELQELSQLQTFKERIDYVPSVQKKKSTEAAPEPFQRYLSQLGAQIWVGKSARNNDRLTFHYASGNDWWLHASGVSGAHVVLKVQKGEEPQSEDLADAMQLALFHSQAKARGEGEVCVTQRKFVSRYGSVAGKVQISKHKNIFVRIDEERLRTIKKVKAS